jgi:hypothetical protein
LRDWKSWKIRWVPLVLGVSTWGGCERYYFYRIRWGLVPKVEERKPAAKLGILFHRLTEVGPDKVDVVRKEVRDAQNELMKMVEAGEDLTGDIARTVEAMTDVFNKAVVLAKIFWDYPVPDYLVTIRDEKPIELDISFRIPCLITGDKYIALPVKVIPDKLQKDTRNDNIWIRDRKTTSKDVSLISAGYEWSTACRLYRIGVRKYLETIGNRGKLVGFILDLIQTPTIKMCGKDEKNAKAWNCSIEDAYYRRVKEWYDEKGEKVLTSKGIMFGEKLYPDELCRQISRADDLQNRDLQHGLFDRDATGTYCTRYDKQCIYYDLCSSSRGAWPGMINRRFNVVERKKKNETPKTTDNK